MPTERFGKVRRMLKNSLAHVVRRIPFTIQLDYDTTDFTQPITLGIDAGNKHIGVSATTTEKELYAADVELRNDIVDKLSTRRAQRRTRRSRLRHRKPRFDNRVSSKKQGMACPIGREQGSYSHVRRKERLQDSPCFQHRCRDRVFRHAED